MKLRINKEIVEKEPSRIFFKILAFHKWVQSIMCMQQKERRVDKGEDEKGDIAYGLLSSNINLENTRFWSNQNHPLFKWIIFLY